MSIYEYDQEKHLRMELVKKKLKKNKSPEIIADELEVDVAMVKDIIAKIEDND